MIENNSDSQSKGLTQRAVNAIDFDFKELQNYRGGCQTLQPKKIANSQLEQSQKLEVEKGSRLFNESQPTLQGNPKIAPKLDKIKQTQLPFYRSSCSQEEGPVDTEK